MPIDYFVFTSGEKGVNGGEDWGVKFVSGKSNQTEWLKWEKEYRDTITAFSMHPNLLDSREILSAKDGALVLLPWSRDRVLLGFIFPYKDIKGRPNISLVAALIECPRGRKMKINPATMAEKLWAQNPLEDISRRAKDRKSPIDRPNSLNLDMETENDAGIAMPDFFNEPEFMELDWPDDNDATLFIDGEKRGHSRKKEEPKPLPRPVKKVVGKKRGFMPAVCAVAVVVILVAIYAIKHSGESEEDLGSKISLSSDDVYIDEEKFTDNVSRFFKSQKSKLILDKSGLLFSFDFSSYEDVNTFEKEFSRNIEEYFGASSVIKNAMSTT
ncbi:hypothetical protein AGMMS50276_32180 [Synergistales bacterium]|nr:hypothetical protein AGMMS50276_32180 [Synergistales bacterium]